MPRSCLSSMREARVWRQASGASFLVPPSAPRGYFFPHSVDLTPQAKVFRALCESSLDRIPLVRSVGRTSNT